MGNTEADKENTTDRTMEDAMVQPPAGCDAALEIRAYDPGRDAGLTEPDPDGDGAPEPWQAHVRDALIAAHRSQRLACDAIRECSDEGALGPLAIDVNTLETVIMSLQSILGVENGEESL